MRNFHVHPNNANLCQPGINLDKLWSLVSEQVSRMRELVDMNNAGYGELSGWPITLAIF